MVALTETQEQVRQMYCIEFLSIKQIAYRRQTSVQAIYKIMKTLKKLGAISPHETQVENATPSFKPFNQIRLHSLHFVVDILKDSAYYQKKVKQKQIDFLDASITIKLWLDKIEVMNKRSYWGNTADEAFYAGLSYLPRILTTLENDYHISLFKPRHHNIRMVSAHLAETNNELAKEYEIKGDKLQIRAEEDGKVAYIIDNSFNWHEFEAVHPITAKPDIEKAQTYFNDIRLRQHYSPSETKNHIDKMLGMFNLVYNHIESLVADRAYYGKNLKEHVKAIRTLSRKVEQLGKVFPIETRKPFKSSQNERQTKLGMY